jgi:catechol 2,3-dioxygenase-like lactoylglutathione lyase family enzyme
MTIQRMDRAGIVIDDLADTVAFFVELALELKGEATVEGRLGGSRRWARGTPVGRHDDADLHGHGRPELIKHHTPLSRGGHSPASANALGIGHVTFAVEGIDNVLDRLPAHRAELVGEPEQYEKSYRLCCVRGPDGAVLEVAEQIGRPAGRQPPRQR